MHSQAKGHIRHKQQGQQLLQGQGQSNPWLPSFLHWAARFQESQHKWA